MTYVSREQFLRLAGIEGEYSPYEPVTVGRNNSIVKGSRRNFSAWMHELQYTSSDSLRRIRPEPYMRKQVFYQDDKDQSIPMSGYKGIVGTKSRKTYTIVSDKYKLIQHRVIVDAMADAADEYGSNVFGTFSDEGGRFNGYAWFSDPESHIKLGDDRKDPMIMGFRFYNSCMGDHVLGGEIVGIRHICSNVGVFGPVLGEVNIRHFKGVDYVSEQIADVLRNYILRREHFNDRIHQMKEDILDPNEQEALLWGLKLDPKTIDRILTNKTLLNPEIRNPAKVSDFDLYNATTAYISYRSGGDRQMLTNTELSSKVGLIFSQLIPRLIDDGMEYRAQYYEESLPKIIPGLVI